jgi:predicted dehydrogenase
MSKKLIRVGVIGAGANTRARHLPGLQSIDGVEVVGVCNRSRASAAEVARQFGIPKVYDQWGELIEEDGFDAVLVGTWPNLHARVTIAALAAGKHVLCEARMARNLQEAKDMLLAAQDKPHLVTQVVPSPLTMNVDQTVKRLVREGFIGDVLAVEVTQKGDYVDFESPLHWRQDAEISGNNVMSMGLWYETIVRWIGEATRVTAMGRTFVNLRQDNERGELRAVSVPDHLDVVAAMACGAQAHFGLSAVSGLGPGSEIALFGSEGTIKVRDGCLLGGRKGDPDFTPISIPIGEDQGWRVEQEFIGAIRGEEVISLTTFEDGVKYMAFTDAVHISMIERREVALSTIY